MSEWHCFADTGQLDQALANYIAQELVLDVDAHGQASLAVSGGITPRHMFQLLSQCALDWSRVWLSLVDERWVAPEDTDSNERLVRETLLQNRAAKAHFISLKSAHDDAADGLAELAQQLVQMPQPTSVVVLGMGGDGHTASWFPQAANLADLLDPQGCATVAATYPVNAPHQRITLTLPAVLKAAEIVIHITGDEKKSVLRRAVQENYPIAAILQQTNTPVTIWWAPSGDICAPE